MYRVGVGAGPSVACWGGPAWRSSDTSSSPGPINSLITDGILYVNPTGIDGFGSVSSSLIRFGTIVALISSLSTVVAIRQRYRRSTGTLREQMRLLVLVAATAGATMLLGFVGTVVGALLGREDDPAFFLALFAFLVLTLLVGVPGAYLIAIFRHGLWDMGLVIRKTVQYGVLVVAFMLLGFVIVALVPTLLIGVGGTDYVSTVIIAAFLAGAFLWLRPRATRVANRLVYGRRATPYEVLSEFSERVGETYSTDDVLPRMAHLLVQATGARRADVWLRVGTELRCDARWPTDVEPPPTRRIRGDEIAGPHDDYLAEVRHQDELLGAITLDLPADDPMNPSKEALVRDLAAQAGLVLRNVRLIEELRASRQRLVAAQDEERRKLERNIHDGVQQQLVALTVQLRLAEQLTERDPAKARELMASLQGRTNEALEDLRDLARGIYPPLLADKGLATALDGAGPQVAGAGHGPSGRGRTLPAGGRVRGLLLVLGGAQQRGEVRGGRTRVDHAGAAGRVPRVRRDRRRSSVSKRRRPRTAPGLQGIADRLDAIGGTMQIESARRAWHETARHGARSERCTMNEGRIRRWPWAITVLAIVGSPGPSPWTLTTTPSACSSIVAGMMVIGYGVVGAFLASRVPGQPDRLADADDRALLRDRRRVSDEYLVYTTTTDPGALPVRERRRVDRSRFVVLRAPDPDPGDPVVFPTGS